MDANGAVDDEVHLVAPVAALEDGLAADEGGRAQVRGDAAQALVVEALPA
jgi:hypothetical protein